MEVFLVTGRKIFCDTKGNYFEIVTTPLKLTSKELHPVYQDLSAIDLLTMKKRESVIKDKPKLPHLDEDQITEDLYVIDSEKDYSEDSSSDIDDDLDESFFS